jgi:ubiquinone biosynthesis protein UbiJ
VSALDARMRLIAREELAASGGPSATADSPSEVASLREQVASLAARVDELEKAAAAPAPKRAARKTAAETSE